ncbi:MAG: hypothetical protein A3A51_04550 [Candidatus Levybacteria bacterium RIFCSPLOWO2_01_FULL_39_10]|nr:MAG: hypothetical protein A3A51_04550 [Candidatus Levybacteria bacterium RIFCSPLOWO2_01_FULL_39_10]
MYFKGTPKEVVRQLEEWAFNHRRVQKVSVEVTILEQEIPPDSWKSTLTLNPISDKDKEKEMKYLPKSKESCIWCRDGIDSHGESCVHCGGTGWEALSTASEPND